MPVPWRGVTRRRTIPEPTKRTTLVGGDEGDDGIRFFDDWIPELKAAYNVRVIGE